MQRAARPLVAALVLLSLVGAMWLLSRRAPGSAERTASRRDALVAEIERTLVQFDKQRRFHHIEVAADRLDGLERFWETPRGPAERARRREKLDLWLRLLAAWDAALDPSYVPSPDRRLWPPALEDSDPAASEAYRKQLEEHRRQADRERLQDALRKNDAYYQDRVKGFITHEYMASPADQHELAHAIKVRIRRMERRDQLLRLIPR